MTLYRDINIDQGSVFSAIIHARDEYDQPIDLTEFDAAARLFKAAAYSTRVAVNFSAEVTDAPTGEITISLTAAQTTALETFNINRLYYVVEIISTESGDGTVIRVQEGVATVNRRV